MKNPNPKMFLRMAQADAYAVALEYVDREEFPELFEKALRFEGYLAHPTYHKLSPGMYTDDTQMSIAVAEVLMSYKDELPIEDEFAFSFWNAFKRDPRDGYSRGLQKILEESSSWVEMRKAIVPNSNKNGAAMRSVPLGLLPTLDMTILAKRQARVTHDTPEGIMSSEAVAVMSRFAHETDLPFLDLLDWGDNYSQAFIKFQDPWTGPVHNNKNDPMKWGVGMNTAWAVCTLLRQERSLMGIMRQTLEWGGDTDSVAAIAWGIASARYQDEVLPEFFDRDLEPRSRYGKEFLIDLGTKLFEHRWE